MNRGRSIVWDDKLVELHNLDGLAYCLLNRTTKEKLFYRTKHLLKGFTGFYHGDENTFFALFPSEKRWIMWFENNEYLLTPNLKISLKINGKDRIFTIKDYGIKINYKECYNTDMVAWDIWMNGEEDVDLFYRINKFYKDEEFYKRLENYDQ